MRTTLSIWLCKLVTLVCHVFGRNGSVFPGEVVTRFDKNVLKRIKYPKKVIVVTGSSGKGSTVNMLAHILEVASKKVVWNKNGSNIDSAIVTLVLNNSKSFSHEVDADILLLEMDERFISRALPKKAISHLLITNITRDQPARNIHPDVIYEKIMESIDDHTTLIINADDPILKRATLSHKGEIISYGVAKTDHSSKKVPEYAVDAAYCPKCHKKLVYECYHYGHIGIYKCSHCDFERGKPTFEAHDVDIINGKFKISDKEYLLNKNVFFALYYTLAAYTISKVIGLDNEIIDKAINVQKITSKRMKVQRLGNRSIEMLESKNENALSYLQSLNYIKDQKGKKTVIMGFENVSRRYKFNDLSWLWDVNFEILNDEDIDKIFCIGRFKYDVATRLDYAGIDKEKIILVEDINTLLDRVKKESKGNIYTMVCFDMTEIINNLLKEKNHEESKK